MKKSGRFVNIEIATKNLQKKVFRTNDYVTIGHDGRSIHLFVKNPNSLEYNFCRKTWEGYPVIIEQMDDTQSVRAY